MPHSFLPPSPRTGLIVALPLDEAPRAPPSGSSSATRLAALRHHVLIVAPVEVAPLLVGEPAAAGALLGDLAEEALARRRRGKEDQKARRRILSFLKPCTDRSGT